jgi:hypothetical protein
MMLPVSVLKWNVDNAEDGKNREIVKVQKGPIQHRSHYEIRIQIILATKNSTKPIANSAFSTA